MAMKVAVYIGPCQICGGPVFSDQEYQDMPTGGVAHGHSIEDDCWIGE